MAEESKGRPKIAKDQILAFAIELAMKSKVKPKVEPGEGVVDPNDRIAWTVQSVNKEDDTVRVMRPKDSKHPEDGMEYAVFSQDQLVSYQFLLEYILEATEIIRQRFNPEIVNKLPKDSEPLDLDSLSSKN